MSLCSQLIMKQNKFREIQSMQSKDKIGSKQQRPLRKLCLLKGKMFLCLASADLSVERGSST